MGAPPPSAFEPLADAPPAGLDPGPGQGLAGAERLADLTDPAATADLPSALAGPAPDETMVVPDQVGEAGTAGSVSDYLTGPGGPRPDETVVTSNLGGGLDAPAPMPSPPSGEAGPLGGQPGGSLWSDPPDSAAAMPAPGLEQPGGPSWSQGEAPGQAPPAIDLDRSVLSTDSGPGVSRTLLLVGLGVVALLALGVLAFTLLAGGDDEADPAPAVTGPGSLVEPHSRETAVEVFYPNGDSERRWVVEVLEPVRDASAELAPPPAAGQAYAATRLRVGNQDTVDAAPLTELRFNAVTSAGEVIDGQVAGCPQGAPRLDTSAALGPSEVAEGEVCWLVPAEALGGLLLGIESTEVAGRIHIALN